MVEIRIAHTASTVVAAKPAQQLREHHHAKASPRPLHGTVAKPLRAVSSSAGVSQGSSAAELGDGSLEVGGGCLGCKNMPVEECSYAVSYPSPVGAVEPPYASRCIQHGRRSRLTRECPLGPGVKGVEASARDVTFGFVTFLFCGIASLVCWQSLLGLLPYIEQHVYEGAPHGNSVLGIYQLGCIAVQIAFILFIDAMKPSLIVAAIFCDATLAALLPLVLTGCTYAVSLTLFHTIALGFGICAGIVSGGSIALAASVPFGFIGSFSMGQGVCGIVAFLVNLVASRYLFDLATYEGAKYMFWMVFGGSAGVSVFSALLLIVALRQPWARLGLQRYWVAKRGRAAAAAAQAAAAATTNEDENKDTPIARCGVWSLSCSCSPIGAHQGLPRPETTWARFIRRWKGTHAAAAEAAAAVRAAGDPRTQELVVVGWDAGRCHNNGISTCSNGSSFWSLQPECALEEAEGTHEVDESTLPSRGWRAILSASWVYLACVFFNFVVTLNLYPRVGPMSWNYSGFSEANEQYIILFGVFCFFDFVGKSLPDLSRYKRMQWLRLSRRGLVTVVLSRTVLIFFFILGMVYKHHSFFNAFAWYVLLMAALAVTSGCCATTAIASACQSVQRFEEREIVGPAAVLMLLLGIATGVYSAYIY